MNKDQVKGKLENLKGRAKEAAGALSGNKHRQADGLIDRVQGAAREKVGDARNSAARRIDRSGDGS
ncbi:MAG TPA: CsbD family protein [Polyangia bacterium]|nr:CsbD family protein [Polyangia bacterium]